MGATSSIEHNTILQQKSSPQVQGNKKVSPKKEEINRFLQLQTSPPNSHPTTPIQTPIKNNPQNLFKLQLKHEEQDRSDSESCEKRRTVIIGQQNWNSQQLNDKHEASQIFNFTKEDQQNNEKHDERIVRQSQRKISQSPYDFQIRPRNSTILKQQAGNNEDIQKRNNDRVKSIIIRRDSHQPSGVFSPLPLSNKGLQRKNSIANLFDNEADLFFQSKGIEEEVNIKLKKTIIIVPKIIPSFIQKDSLTSQKDDQLEKQKLESNDSTPNSKNPQVFKEEIIQASKHKTTKDSFKKGNIFLTVQEDEPKQLAQSQQVNIIGDLVTNNISITDFLISENRDLKQQILIQKQKKNLKSRQDEENLSKRGNKKKLGSQTNSPQFVNGEQIKAEHKDQGNIIISYSQDWEKMRKSGFKDQNFPRLVL